MRTRTPPSTEGAATGSSPLGLRARLRRKRAFLTQHGPFEARRVRRRVAHQEALVAEGILTIGRHSIGSPRIMLWRDDEGRPLGGKVRIGAFCSLDGDALIFTGGHHRVDWVSTFPHRVAFDLEGAHRDGHPASRGDVEIGHDVWLATGCMVLSGVTVGHGAVVGAGAVVTKDVRPYAIVAGNPAREVRRRFDDATVDRLLALAWWDWPDEEIHARVDELCAPPAPGP